MSIQIRMPSIYSPVPLLNIRQWTKGISRLTSLISLLILRALIRVRLSSVFKVWYAEDPFIFFKSFLYFSCRLKMEREG